MKKLNKLIFGLFSIILITTNVNAETIEIDSLEKLKSCIAIPENICKLTSNISTSETITLKNSITIDGNGNEITSPTTIRKTFEIYAENDNINVTFNNINITNNHNTGRCIDTRTGNIDLTLDNTTLTTTGVGNTQTLNIGGDTKDDILDITIKNSTLNIPKAGYGIVTFNPVNLTINNSNITGYNAIYMKAASNSQGSAGSNVTIENNSKITTTNIHTEASSNFGTIVLEDGNIKINIVDSTIGATSNVLKQFIFLENIAYMNTTEQNIITISGNSTITVDEDNETNRIAKISSKTNTQVIIKENVTTNIEIPGTYLEIENQLIKTENGYIVKKIIEKPTTELSEETKTENDNEVKITIEKDTKVENILTETLNNNKELAEKVKDINVKIDIEIGKIDSNLIKKEVTKAMQETAGKATIVEFFDITIAVNNAIDGNRIDTLNILNEEIELKVLLPESLKNTNKDINRIYYVVREHEGNIQLLEATLSDDGNYLTFKSDSFSTYALAYEDNIIENETIPPTYDNITTYIIIGSLSIVSLIGISQYSKKKRFN